MLLFSLLLSSLSFATPLVVLDPGHEPSRPGAIGVCGQEERIYNDEVAAALKAQLEASGVQVTLTHEPGQEVSLLPDADRFVPDSQKPAADADPRLYGRPSLANRLGANLYVSLHHDSALAIYQETVPGLCGLGKDGKQLNQAFKAAGYRPGFSIWIYHGNGDDARYQASLKLALAIGQGMVQKLGRVPSNYHSDRKECESCKVLNAQYGVWEKNLAVLRSAEMPAVLVEVGVIVDPQDEKAVNNDAFRQGLGSMMRDAINASLSR